MSLGDWPERQPERGRQPQIRRVWRRDFEGYSTLLVALDLPDPAMVVWIRISEAFEALKTLASMTPHQIASAKQSLYSEARRLVVDDAGTIVDDLFAALYRFHRIAMNYYEPLARFLAGELPNQLLLVPSRSDRPTAPALLIRLDHHQA
jgi:hypothetical protein